ncbi:MAG: hypothetical protein ACQETH_17285 [Candidatus Rifleibacteriota bacterium]
MQNLSLKYRIIAGEFMVVGKILAGVFGLLFIYFFVESVTSHVRQGWYFDSLESKSFKLFALINLQDLFLGLVFLWIAVFQTSYVYGRMVVLWCAHIAILHACLGEFVAENKDGKPMNVGCIGRPLVIVMGAYLYYLGLVQGISLADIFEIILDTA